MEGTDSQIGSKTHQTLQASQNMSKKRKYNELSDSTQALVQKAAGFNSQSGVHPKRLQRQDSINSESIVNNKSKRRRLNEESYPSQEESMSMVKRFQS